MLGEAIQFITALPRDQKLRADTLEALAAQIEGASGGSWTAVRGAGTDGSDIFLGRQGEALVIPADGRLCRGAIGKGIEITQGGLRPNYPALHALD